MDMIEGSPRSDSQEQHVPIGTSSKNKAKLQVLQEQERKFRPAIYWYLTFRCNLACAHCSVKSSPWVDTSDDLTTEECMKVVDQIAELDVSLAILTGGEVLIRPDALQILQALHERNIVTSMESNGIRLTKEVAAYAKKAQEKRLMRITVSLDGGTKEAHERLRGPRSFDKTMRGLQNMYDAGVGFSIQCVVNHTSVETIPQVYEIAKRFDPYCVQTEFISLNPIGRGVGLVKEIGLRREDLDRMFELIQTSRGDFRGQTVIKVPPAAVPPKYLPLVLKESKVGCSTTCQFPLLGVLPNGNVSVCALSRENDDLQFGNIRNLDKSLKEIWQDTRMDLMRSEYVAAEHLTGICGDCVWKHGCKGACRAWAYEDGGSFDSPYPICEALEEADAFPKMYRLSLQNEAVAKKFQQMAAGCGCG